MKRYLLYLSYIGTRYSGIQVQRSSVETELKGKSSVGEILELALKGCKSIKNPNVVVSSRTDAGVHALRNTVHVDLEAAYGEIQPRYIVTTANSYFKHKLHDIRVQEARMVPDDFSSRFHAQARHYLYRFAVRKPNVTLIDEYNSQASLPIPLLECNRCYFILNPKFDFEAVQAASRLFLGTQNCIALLGKPKLNLRTNNRSPIRTVYSLELKPSRPLLDSPYSEYYDYWEVHCFGKSFLYNQVRRTVAALIAVAQGVLTIDDVHKFFKYPRIKSWNHRAQLVPPHGLYLQDVIYDEADLVLPVPETEPAVPVDLKNITGSIHEKINLRNTVLREKERENREKKKSEVVC